MLSQNSTPKIMFSLHIFEALARFTAISSEFFTLSFLVFSINVLLTITGKVFKAGTITGKFYKTHLHQHTVRLLKITLQLIGLSCYALYKLTEYTYNHRREILSTLNTARHQVGNLFTYKSPAPATAPATAPAIQPFYHLATQLQTLTNAQIRQQFSLKARTRKTHLIAYALATV